MSPSKIVVYCLLLLLVAAPAAAITEIPAFEPVSCPVTLPVTAVEGTDIVCGYVQVPQLHADPSGPSIRLAAAVIKSTSRRPAPDPLVMEQGGPGGSTLDFFVPLILGPVGQRFRAQRDIVLVEQRGTLFSQPFLGCTELSQLTLDTLNVDLTDEEAEALTSDSLAKCRERLIGDGVDLSIYNSVENAADIPLVLSALGYDQFNYYGVSYGTQLGYHLMRDHGHRLRSVIMDANSPLQLNFWTGAPFSADRSFRLLFSSCAANAECSSAFPNLEQVFFDLVDRMNQTPVVVPIFDSENNVRYDMLLDGDSIMALTFNVLYITSYIPSLPQFIFEMAGGDFTWIQSIAPNLVLDNTDADAMYFSVMCAEDGNFSPGDFDLGALYPQLGRYQGVSLAQLTTFCGVMNVDALESFVNDPLESSIPTLLFSGEFDPITPPSYSDVAAQTLSNSFAYTFPGVGHGALLSGVCSISIMEQFLSNPHAEPDTACINEMSLSFNIPDLSPLSLVPLRLPDLGVSALVPDGWQQSGQGVYLRQRSIVDQTAIIFLSWPAAEIAPILEFVAEALEIDVPLLTAERTANGRNWELYDVMIEILPGKLAFSQSDGMVYLVGIISTSAEIDQLTQSILLPVIDAFDVFE